MATAARQNQALAVAAASSGVSPDAMYAFRRLARSARKYSGGSSSLRARSSTRGEIIATGNPARPSRRRYRYGGDGVTRADVSAAVRDGQLLEPLGQEGLSLFKERRAGLGMVKPVVDVQLDRDPPVTVGVGKFLDVLSDSDPVAGRVREAVTDEQRPARGAASAHDEAVEDADEDRDFFDVLVLRLEQLLGREAREGTRTLGLIGVGGGDALGREVFVEVANVEAAGQADSRR